MTAATGSGSPTPAPAVATARRVWPMQLLAWLLMPALVLGASRFGASPGDMPPVALAVGPAVAVALLRGPGLRLPCMLLLGTVLAVCEGLAQLLGQPYGLDLRQRLVDALGAGALAGAQACLSAGQVRRIMAELAADRRPPALRRIGATFRLVALRLLPLAVLTGMAMVGLHIGLHGLGDAHQALRDVDHLPLLLYSHALASSVSLLIVVPLLSREHGPLPNVRVLAGLLAAAPLLALALGQSTLFVIALPVYTFLGGWLGGLFGASLASGLTVALLLHIDALLLGASPFDGPDGYVVLLATAFRLTVVGLIGMVWNEPRTRARGSAGRRDGDVRSGAATFRNVMALEWHLARAGYGRGASTRRPVLWLHIDMPVNRPAGSRSTLAPLSAQAAPDEAASEPAIQMLTIGPIGSLTPAGPATGAGALEGIDAHGQVRGDGLDSSLPSPRLPSLMQALARGLRGHDAVVPIAGEALIVLVDQLDRNAVASVVQRIDVLLLREGRRHLAPAEIRQAALVHAGAAAVLLTSARYLSIDL